MQLNQQAHNSSCERVPEKRNAHRAGTPIAHQAGTLIPDSDPPLSIRCYVLRYTNEKLFVDIYRLKCYLNLHFQPVVEYMYMDSGEHQLPIVKNLYWCLVLFK